MPQQFSQQNPTELEGFVDESELSKRDRRIRKTMLLYHIEDMTQEQIAEEIGVTRPTISEYINSETAKQFEPYFSSKEKAELKDWMERQFWQAFNASTEAFRQIKDADDASYQTRLRAARELQENQDRLANWFQEVGLIPKPKERKEVTEQSTNDDVMERMQEALEQKEQEEEIKNES